KAAYGWQPIRLLFQQDGESVAAASILVRKVGPVSICYVPKGPIVDYGNSELAGFALETIVHTAKRQRAIYVKIDPDIPLDDAAAGDVLRRHGFRPGEN